MLRRTFLKRGLFGGLILASGGAVALALRPSKLVFAPRRELRVLDPRQFGVLAAIASRVLPIEGVDHVEVAHVADSELLPNATPEARVDLGRALLLFESPLSGLLLDGRTRPFTALSFIEQDRALEHFRDSRFVLRRGIYHALRSICLVAHYRSPSVWEGLGYPGPPEIAS